MGIAPYVVDDWCERAKRRGLVVGMFGGFAAGFIFGLCF